MSNEKSYLTPYLAEGPNGSILPAEWGKVFVPENRTKPDSNTIEVPFVRFKSNAENPSSPVFFLDGGPGDIPSTLNCLEQLIPLFVEPFLDKSDVVILEQRGVGHSRPSLDCPGIYELPLDRPLDRRTELEFTKSFFEAGAKFWADSGVDLSGYTVREMAADVDSVRRFLGYEKIKLLGGSFGSHHCIAVLKYFGEYVDRAVIASVEGPDHTIKLPSNIQLHLEQLSDKVSEDPDLSSRIPDFIALVQSVINKLEKEPVVVEIKDPYTCHSEQVSVTVGKLDLQILTANALGRIDVRALPAKYRAMSDGDFTWLANNALRHRNNPAMNLMPLLVDCASGATEKRRARIVNEAETSVLGNAINSVVFDFCNSLCDMDLGDAFRAPLISDVPTLLISGTMDARTPVSNAEEVLPGLANGQHVIVEGATHSMFQEAGSQILRTIKEFMGSEQFKTTSPSRIAAPFEFEQI